MKTLTQPVINPVKGSRPKTTFVCLFPVFENKCASVTFFFISSFPVGERKSKHMPHNHFSGKTQKEHTTSKADKYPSGILQECVQSAPEKD